MKKMDEIADFAPLPSAAQLAYHQDELAAFISFILVSILFMSRNGEMVRKILVFLIRRNWIRISGLGF